jgi:chemotaxis protein methyltransferase WspC
MESSLNKIKNILKKEIGLDTSTIGEATISKILNERMRSCRIVKLDEYYTHLTNTPDELHSLLESSLIPETWFFRDDKPFKAILKSIIKQRLSQPGKICKILCIPCSTGEEPYSIAIYLHNNGIPSTAYDIQAIDISHQSIGIAKQAIYGNNSFRGKNSRQYIDKYFTSTDTGLSLNNDIKSSVKFHQVNILTANSLPFNIKFDFILCRNLLIYFDSQTKALAYNNLNNILNNDGAMFIGHAEFGSVPEDTFTIRKLDSVFCLVKNTFNTKATDKFKKPIEIKAFSNAEKYKPEKHAEPVSHKKTQCTKQNSSLGLMQQARILADSGKLREAEALCLQCIDKYGDHERIFFLLGLISESHKNSSQAHAFYKKALYLNPYHYETLIHLSFLIESQGDFEASRRLKERAGRVEKIIHE